MLGEPEFVQMADRLKNGIMVSDVVYEDLKQLCTKYSVCFSIDI